MHMSVENSNTIGERVAQLLADRSLSQNQFAKQAGIGVATVNHVIRGRNNPDYNFIAALFKLFPNVNRDWILLGTGEAYVENIFNQVQEPALPYSSKSITQTGLFFSAEKIIYQMQQEIEDLKLRLTNLESV